MLELIDGDLDEEAVEAWVPTRELPDEVVGLPGLWFWGNSATEVRWHNSRLELRPLALPGAGRRLRADGRRARRARRLPPRRDRCTSYAGRTGRSPTWRWRPSC